MDVDGFNSHVHHARCVPTYITLVIARFIEHIRHHMCRVKSLMVGGIPKTKGLRQGGSVR
jgi:hypothetical protein